MFSQPFKKKGEGVETLRTPVDFRRVSLQAYAFQGGKEGSPSKERERNICRLRWRVNATRLSSPREQPVAGLKLKRGTPTPPTRPYTRCPRTFRDRRGIDIKASSFLSLSLSSSCRFAGSLLRSVPCSRHRELSGSRAYACLTNCVVVGNQ